MTTDKILTDESLPLQLAHDHKYGTPILLATGCFDILHRGHVELLEKAKDQLKGHTFWIGLNSDGAVRALKGNGRPIHDYHSRATVMAAIQCVDQVFEIDEIRVTETILFIRPKAWIKGSDYTLETLDQEERKAADLVGATIHFMPLLLGYSTTAILKRL